MVPRVHGICGVLLAIVLGGFVGARLAVADVVHLKSGSQLEVEAWRDVGDALELELGGGLMRIQKSEVQRIERTQPPAPHGAPSPGTGPPVGPADCRYDERRSRDELVQDWLVDFVMGIARVQHGPRTTEQAGKMAAALRHLARDWPDRRVPGALRAGSERARRAIELLAEALETEARGRDPTRQREVAERAIGDALAEIGFQWERCRDELARAGRPPG